MPTRPMRPCRQPGCPALVNSGHCPQHARTAASSDYQRRLQADEAKGSDRQFYSSPAWRKLRAQVLREEPRCCCGCGERSDTVDHIKPRRDYPELALARLNLRAYFGRCHNRHTARSGGGFGNRKRVPA